jgi:hypothetical protein
LSLWLTVGGAHFYFWGRIVYAIRYTADLPLARSLVWNIPTIGILMRTPILFRWDAWGCPSYFAVSGCSVALSRIRNSSPNREA